MRTILAIVLITFSNAAMAANEKTASPSPKGETALRSAFEMNKMLGRGIAIGGALDSPKQEGEWGVTLQEEYFQIIKDAGFNSIRLPVRWNTRAGNEPPYTIEPNFFQRVDWAIQNCLSRNMPVVLTTHHYDELYSDPNGQKEKFVAIWKQIAERYKDYPNLLVFDPLMEATGNLDAAKWNSLLKETIATIRRTNPKRAISIDAAGLNCIDNLHLLELPKDDRNIIVGIFYYEPMKFTHQGASWEVGSEKWLGTKWTGSDAEKKAINDAFDIAAEWSKKNDRPIYLNEFGAYEKADMDSRVRWTRCVVDAAIERGFSISYWEFCSAFGLYDQQTKSWRKGLLEAVIAPEKTVTDAFSINKLIGRGVNIGNALESPSEGEWGITVQEEYFQLIKDAGFNSIRLPISWSTHALSEKPYTIDVNFFNRIDWAVKNTLSRKMAIVVNVHHYRELYKDPNGHKERFIALWKQIAEHYKDYPNTLIFELLNEPEGNLKATEWNAILKEALTTVRESNPNRMVVIGPDNWNDIRRLDTLELPKEDRNIIVTAHYYLPFHFTHQGAHWAGEVSQEWLGTKWTGSDEEKQAIRKDFDNAAEWGKKNNRPIYIGEFGAYEKADMDSRIRWTKFVADEAVKRNFSFTYWEFCYIFGLYDPETKTWRKGLLEAVIPPK